MNRMLIYGGLVVALIVMVVCFVIILQMRQFHDLQIIFLDIGQGDAVLLSYGSNQILIDGGPNETELLEELGKYIPFWDRTIEIVIATHPDQDHISGLVGVFDSYDVEQFWHTETTKNTSVFSALERIVKSSAETEMMNAWYGLKAQIGFGNLSVVYPYNKNSLAVDDVNDASVATVLRVGEESFYFGGDLSSEIEDLLPIKDIDILKVSHHGSQSSTSEEFLRKTQPKAVVVSSGKNNRYDHPHDEVLLRSYRAGANVLRTDQLGTIIFTCKKEGCNVSY